MTFAKIEWHKKKLLNLSFESNKMPRVANVLPISNICDFKSLIKIQAEYPKNTFYVATFSWK